MKTSTPPSDLAVVGRARTALPACARGFALFLGGFVLLNLLVGLRSPGFDMNQWWVDLSPLPDWAARVALLAAACCLLAFGVGADRRFRRFSLLVTLMLLAVALKNAADYYALRARGVIHSGADLPFSLLLAGALTVVALAQWQAPGRRLSWSGRALLALVYLASLVTFPVAQIYCFGTTDYRRPADVIVVFGAYATGDGRPSLALSDRVRTACDLYREGYAPRLLLSGGPTRGKAHETDAMRDLAHQLGVPDRAILVDKGGLSTHDTVQNTTRLFPQLGVRRVLAVSHCYHLPRNKMSYQRAGWEVYTVPAQDPRQPARQYPFMLFRETAATWAYFLWGK